MSIWEKGENGSYYYLINYIKRLIIIHLDNVALILTNRVVNRKYCKFYTILTSLLVRRSHIYIFVVIKVLQTRSQAPTSSRVGRFGLTPSSLILVATAKMKYLSLKLYIIRWVAQLWIFTPSHDNFINTTEVNLVLFVLLKSDYNHFFVSLFQQEFNAIFISLF